MLYMLFFRTKPENVDESSIEAISKEKARELAEIKIGASSAEQEQKSIRREVPKVGRNDFCSCGSGKKYKHCCGA